MSDDAGREPQVIDSGPVLLQATTDPYTQPAGDDDEEVAGDGSDRAGTGE